VTDNETDRQRDTVNLVASKTGAWRDACDEVRCDIASSHRSHSVSVSRRQTVTQASRRRPLLQRIIARYIMYRRPARAPWRHRQVLVTSPPAASRPLLQTSTHLTQPSLHLYCRGWKVIGIWSLPVGDLDLWPLYRDLIIFVLFSPSLQEESSASVADGPSSSEWTTPTTA